jgi:hypothetical protein
VWFRLFYLFGPVSSLRRNSDSPYDAKPNRCERRHRQLHIGNDDPSAVLLVKAFDACIPWRERREGRKREAQAVDAEDDKRKV